MSVQFDLGSLGLGSGGGGVDLNDALSARTPQNSNVFSKPFGDKTVWCTPSGGTVTAVFLFDPHQQWTERHIMASITTDWPAAIRAALARQLLPESLLVAEGKPNLQRTTYRALVTSLPSKVLEQYLLAHPDKMAAFAEMVAADAKAEHEEEAALTEALRTRAFKFAFAVAIDAFPANIPGRSRGGRGSGSGGGGGDSALNPSERKGVLTFYIEGRTGGGGPEGEGGCEEEEEEEEGGGGAAAAAAATGDRRKKAAKKQEGEGEDKKNKAAAKKKTQRKSAEAGGGAKGDAQDGADAEDDEEEEEEGGGGEEEAEAEEEDSTTDDSSTDGGAARLGRRGADGAELRRLRKLASGTIRKMSAKAAKKEAKAVRKEVRRIVSVLELAPVVASAAAKQAVVRDKRLPLSATDFLGEVQQWFDTVVATRAAKMANAANPGSLYQ